MLRLKIGNSLCRVSSYPGINLPEHHLSKGKVMLEVKEYLLGSCLRQGGNKRKVLVCVRCNI